VTQTSLNDVGSFPQASPAAEVFSTRLLLSQKSSATVKSGSVEAKMEVIEKRAILLTATLEHIEGFSHGGLND
jgi:hypothetical protein